MGYFGYPPPGLQPNDPGTYEIGTNFRVKQPVLILGLYVASGGNNNRAGHNGKLWTNTSSTYTVGLETLVAQCAMDNPTVIGMKAYYFDSPYLALGSEAQPVYLTVSHDINSTNTVDATNAANAEYCASGSVFNSELVSYDGVITYPVGAGTFVSNFPDFYPNNSFNNSFYYIYPIYEAVGVTTSAGVFFPQDSGTGTYTSGSDLVTATLTLISDSDTGAVVDINSILATALTDADTASAVETEGPVKLSDTDLGTGADTEAVAAGVSDIETAGVVDAGEANAATLSDVEVAAGVDAGEFISNPAADADTGSGVDAEVSAAPAVVDADTAAAVDASVSTGFSDADTATVADTEAPISPAVSDGDTGTWVEGGSGGPVGVLLQQATPFASTGDANPHINGAPALPSVPTVGNTDILCAVSSATVTTPAGYTRDTFDATFAGIYIFRRIVQTGDTGATFNVALGASRPLWCGRYELTGAAAVDVAALSKNYSSSTTTARSSNALVSNTTDGVLYFATDQQSTARTWSSITPAGLVQIDTGAPTGGTAPYNGVTIYANGLAAGTNTLAAISNVSTTRYQIIGVSYTFSGGGTSGESIAATLTDADTAAAVEGEAVGGGTTPSDTDSAVVLDAGETLASPLSDADTAVGVELETASAAVTAAETATAVDAESGTNLNDADTGAAADAAAVATTLTDADTAAGVDIEGPFGMSSADTGTAVDAEGAIPATVADAETAAAVDTESVDSTGGLTPKSDTETAAGVDNALTLGVAIADADTATALDAQALALMLLDLETGTGIDAELVQAAVLDSDFATVLEAALLAQYFSDGDIGVSVENESIFISVGVTIWYPQIRTLSMHTT